MASIFTLLLDICFPPRIEELVVRTLSLNTIKILYHEVRYADAIALLPYQHPSVRALIHEAKFHNNLHAQHLLAHALTLYAEKNRAEAAAYIPIPLSHKRWRERGYNQVVEVLKKTSLTMEAKILTRSRHTVTQTSLDRTARLQNMKGAFVVKEAKSVVAKNIIIVDDVLTTGATLVAARAALAVHLSPKSNIICLALAH